MSELGDVLAGLDAAVQDQVAAAMADVAAAQSRAVEMQRLLAEVRRAAALAAQQPPPPTPDPAPDPGPLVPRGATAVRIGAATYPLAAVDPASDRVTGDGRKYAGGRGPDELVIYTVAGSRTGTNQHGAEVPVVDGVPGVVTVGRAGGLTVPDGGLVLSGHDRASTWIQENAHPGARVKFVVGGGGSPAPAPASGGARAGNIAVWVMMWPDSPQFDWASIPDEVDEVRLAFLIEDGKPVGDGSWGQAKLQEALDRFLGLRPSRIVSWAMGGGGYEVSIPSTGAYLKAVAAAEKRWLPAGRTFGGANVDWESSRFKAAGDQVAEVLRAAKRERPGLFCSWSPNSSYRNDYAEVCRRNPDVVDALGYQCYDIPGLTYGDPAKVHPTVQEVYEGIFAGLRPDQLEVAMMIEPGRDDRWTLAQCQDAARRIRDDFGVTRTAFWQAGRPEFPAWARAMRAINPAPAS